jgi:protein-tyrosine-phosphatase/N-acetylglutamate synthase-like GNAT family acetyltransferase
MNTPLAISAGPSLHSAVQLLQTAQLPTEDLTAAHCDSFFFSGPASQPTGLVGLEIYGDVALLRSLVVAPGRRGSGEGGALLEHAENQARARGVRTLYLLTTTAAPFFAKHGYAPAARDRAPAAICATREFSGICPASSAFLCKQLVFNVLILCTGNSARSILGEALVTRWGGGRFVGFSAGSAPKGRVHPVALQLLEEKQLPTAGMRSKSWDEFAAPGAPPLDFVFTVCDNAAGESCPIWPGGPLQAHWGIPDPAAVEGSNAQQLAAFRAACDSLERRIRAFVELPFDTLDRAQLQQRLRELAA